MLEPKSLPSINFIPLPFPRDVLDPQKLYPGSAGPADGRVRNENKKFIKPEKDK